MAAAVSAMRDSSSPSSSFNITDAIVTSLALNICINDAMKAR
jgi:hypothetical protein